MTDAEKRISDGYATSSIDSDLDALVARLRANMYAYGICQDAADAITALRKRTDRLKIALSDLHEAVFEDGAPDEALDEACRALKESHHG